MPARGFPKRGLTMETIAALFGAIARCLRGLFDLASMAVGIAPTTLALADAAVPVERVDVGLECQPQPLDDPFQMSRAEREFYGLWG